MRNALMLAINTVVRQALVEGEGNGGEQVEIKATDIAAMASEAELPETDEVRQARKARLLLAEAQALKVQADGTAVPPEVIEIANREIMICWQEYAGIGGVYDLHKQAQKKLRNIAQHILTIARECAAAAWRRSEADPDCDFGKLASAMFRNAMYTAEAFLRGNLDLTQEDAEDKLDTFLAGSWSVYRSQIRTSMEAGFDPRDHETIYSMRKAVEATKAATSTGTRDDGNKDAESNAETEGNAAPEHGTTTGGAPQGTQATKDEERSSLDWSELDAISQNSPSVKSALILLHQAIHGTAMGNGNAEERVTNILNVAIREITKLERREALADDGSDGMDEDGYKPGEREADSDDQYLEAMEEKAEAVEG